MKLRIGSRIRLTLANTIPFLGVIRRRVRATVDAQLPPARSYAQHGEDQFILRQLARFKLDGSIYVDVGANHPTSLSNTYLLYRHGLRGVVVEPNLELLSLYQKVRVRDIAIGAGCGQSAALRQFHVRSTPVMSSFSGVNGLRGLNDPGSKDRPRILKVTYVPVLPLDLIVTAVEFDYISLLSIDTEGSDYDVLQGASQTLEKTLLLCIEANNEQEEIELHNYVKGRSFEMVGRFGCNLIFQNVSGTFDRYLK